MSVYEGKGLIKHDSSYLRSFSRAPTACLSMSTIYIILYDAHHIDEI